MNMSTTAPTDHDANFGNAESSHPVPRPLKRGRGCRAEFARGFSFQIRRLTPLQRCLNSASDRAGPNLLTPHEPIRKGGV